MDSKLLQILEECLDQGWSGVRVEPFNQFSSSTTTGSIQETPASKSDSSHLHELRTQSPEIRQTLSPTRASASAPAAATRGRFPRRPRRRRVRPISQEAAKRALVQSSQKKAEATVRSNHTLGMIVQSLSKIENTLQKVIQRVS